MPGGAPIGKNLNKPVRESTDRVQILLSPERFRYAGRLAAARGMVTGKFIRILVEAALDEIEKGKG